MNREALQNRCRQAAAAVEKAAAAAGRPGKVTLLAVSKTVGADAIKALYDIGIRDFGENREPLLEEKKRQLPEDIRWHFIGRLQSNKIRRVVRSAAVIHSVDSAAMLERIDRIAGEEKRRPEIFIEVSVSGEEQKGGIAPEELATLLETAVNCHDIDLRGLMTMAPFDAGREELLRVFGGLAALQKQMNGKFGREILPELSMGMSGDFAEAIECGSTIVRLGTVIFADRP